MKIETIFEIVGAVCKISECNGYLYIETPTVTDTLNKIYDAGFKSLTDCFITKDKQIYFQITNFLTKQSLFITSQYETDIFDGTIQELYPNYIAYEIEIKQYLDASKFF